MVLSDFGAALTVQSTDPAAGRPMTATMAYVAPEVITGEPLDGRADVYSLGCTLFRLLAGEHPFSTVDGIPATVRAHLETAPPRLSDRLSWASPQLDNVIAKALAKSPADRYRTAGQFAADAVAAADHASARSSRTAADCRPSTSNRTLPRGPPSVRSRAVQPILLTCSPTPERSSPNGLSYSSPASWSRCSSSTPRRSGSSAAPPTRHRRARHTRRRAPRHRQRRWPA